MRHEYYVLYVLELQDGCYYVGITQNHKHRLSQHFKGNGSVWTSLHKPIKKLGWKRLRETDKNQVYRIESMTTLRLMNKFGWKMVRGGWFSDPDEPRTYHHLRGHKQTIIWLGYNFDLFMQQKGTLRWEYARLHRNAGNRIASIEGRNLTIGAQLELGL